MMMNAAVVAVAVVVVAWLVPYYIRIGRVYLLAVSQINYHFIELAGGQASTE